MTDKLKCPFCGAELEDDWYEYENGRGDTEYAKSGLLKCPDWDCRGYKLKLEPEIWQALIVGKKAQDALKEIVNFFDTECGKDDMYFYNLIEDNIAKYREITSITKREE